MAREEAANVRCGNGLAPGRPASEKADNATLTGSKDGATAAGAFMLPSLIEAVLPSGAATGYPLTWLLAHMEWALLDKPGVAGRLEYETRLNHVLPKFFVPPDQFLLEIRERRSARQSARIAN